MKMAKEEITDAQLDAIIKELDEADVPQDDREIWQGGK